MLKNQRSLVIAITPMQTVELKTIFSDQPESLRRKLGAPPTLRGSGWDLPSSSRVELLRGELIRTVERGRMIVDLYRDGTLIIGGQIYRNFLAWSDKTDSQIHPLALIEWIVNFVRFYRLVLQDFRVPPDQLQITIEFRNMHLGNHKTRLGWGPVGTYSPLGAGGKEAPMDSWSKQLKFKAQPYDPARVAFAVIREIYVWFGHSEEAIPYTMDSADDRMIDIDQIATIR